MSRFATLAVHAGRIPDSHAEGPGTPIHLSTTFRMGQEVADAILDPARLRHLPFYTRYSNPSQQAAARKVAALEGAADALVFSSGMSAITSTLRAVLEPGSTLVASRTLYGGADTWLDLELPRLQVRVLRVDIKDLPSVADALCGARALYFEPMSNPLLGVADVPRLVAMARAAGALTIVDNTFLSPANFRPMEHGVDLVVHAATKYLNGHADVTAGVVCGSSELMDRIWPRLVLDGGVLDPHAAYLLERGMKTLELRMARHNENGMALAQALLPHPAVERVFYPGLTHHADYPLARTLFPERCGGVVSFEARGGLEGARRVLEKLGRGDGPYLVAPSLGGVESLVCLPASTSHPRPETRRRMGIPEGLVRISAGIEDSRDLVEALMEALH